MRISEIQSQGFSSTEALGSVASPNDGQASPRKHATFSKFWLHWPLLDFNICQRHQAALGMFESRKGALLNTPVNADVVSSGNLKTSRIRHHGRCWS